MLTTGDMSELLVGGHVPRVLQILLADSLNCSHVTNLICKRGIFKWKVMPIGIQPASDSLSHQMQTVFSDLFTPDPGLGGAPMVRDIDFGGLGGSS